MNSFFNPAEIVRNLTGAVAAIVFGTTLIAAAAGPAATAAATHTMTAAAESNIVARA
ncbi:MAG: hypothetical protein H7267_12625 [Sandarakinorhabdus sp.]|nr:hypothetical protein [Sandarakinorhabdus sp.]